MPLGPEEKDLTLLGKVFELQPKVFVVVVHQIDGRSLLWTANKEQ